MSTYGDGGATYADLFTGLTYGTFGADEGPPPVAYISIPFFDAAGETFLVSDQSTMVIVFDDPPLEAWPPKLTHSVGVAFGDPAPPVYNHVLMNALPGRVRSFELVMADRVRFTIEPQEDA